MSLGILLGLKEKIWNFGAHLTLQAKHMDHVKVVLVQWQPLAG